MSNSFSKYYCVLSGKSTSVVSGCRCWAKCGQLGNNSTQISICVSVYCCDSARWTRRQESGHPDPGLSRRILESSCARKCCTEKRFFSQQVHSVVNSRRDLSRVSHCHTMAGDIYSSIEGGLQRTDIGANSWMTIPLNFQLLITYLTTFQI